MENISLWKAGTHIPISYPPLNQNIEVDVAIVGGGITGMTAALELTKHGKKVAVFEAHRIGDVTASSTGNLYVAVQPYYHQIAKKFNLKTAKAIVLSRQFAIDYIETIIRELDIYCGFTRRPWYMYADENQGIEIINKEVEVFKQMGISFDYTNEMPMALKFKKAALMANQARFNPLSYVISIAEYLHEKGVLIYENTRVIKNTETNHCILETQDGFKIQAKKVILATHTPISSNPEQMFTPHYRSNVLAIRTKDNVYPEGQFWKAGYPHFVLATQGLANKPTMLFIAGSQHQTDIAPHAEDDDFHYHELEDYLKANFAIKDILYRWSAQHFSSTDNIPYIGLAKQSAKYTYMATSYFAGGLVYSALAGIILANTINEKTDELFQFYQSS